MRKSKIFLIAGHAGKGSGACGIIDEGEQTMQLRNHLVGRINQLRPDIPIEIDEDSNPLRDVVRHINNSCDPNDLCIDIHFNSVSDTSANGTEVLIKPNATTVSQELAEVTLNAMVQTLGTHNRGIKHRNNLAMIKLKCHCVLLEMCFVRNKVDTAKYLDHFETLVENLAQAIIRTYNRL